MSNNFLFGINFLIFIIVLIYMNILLRQKGIKTNHLLIGEKGFWIKFSELLVYLTTFPLTFIWAFLVFDNFNNWILFNVKNFFYLGWLINLFGVIIYCISIYTLGSSWRLGIDINSEEKMIKEGIYNFSRHPAYLGFYLMFIGLSISFPSIIIYLLTILSIISLINQGIIEEENLIERFNEEYKEYQKNVNFILNIC